MSGIHTYMYTCILTGIDKDLIYIESYQRPVLIESCYFVIIMWDFSLIILGLFFSLNIGGCDLFLQTSTTFCVAAFVKRI